MDLENADQENQELRIKKSKFSPNESSGLELKWKLESKFLIAIQDNDIETVEHLLINHHLDPDSTFNLGFGNQVPALCLCVERGLYEMTKLLISFNASVNQVDPDVGYSPLHFATSHSFVDLVSLLVQHRANVNLVSNYGQTPLHLACQTACIPIVEILIQAGANPEKRDRDGRTALAMACLCNQSAIAQYLLLEASKITPIDVNTLDNVGNSPLLLAVNSGLTLNHELISYLLKSGANVKHVNKHGSSALITTIRRASEHSLDGYLIVRDLINHGADINSCENQVTPITQRRCSSAMSSRGQSPCLHFGSSFGSESAIHLSISRGQDRITELLVRSGAGLSSSNSQGFLPLHRIAREEKRDLFKLMIDAGADLVHVQEKCLSPRTSRYMKVVDEDSPEASVFLADENGIIRDFLDERINNLLIQMSPKSSRVSVVTDATKTTSQAENSSNVRYFPSLKHMSRVKFRKWLERRADSVIARLILPESVKNYLLMTDH